MASANTLLESTATLEAQALRCGLSQAWVDGLKASNVATLGQLAYAVTMPGTPLTDVAVQNFASLVCPAVALTVSELTAFKRLVLEAQTMTISNLRVTVQGTDKSAGRKLAPRACVAASGVGSIRPVGACALVLRSSHNNARYRRAEIHRPQSVFDTSARACRKSARQTDQIR